MYVCKQGDDLYISGHAIYLLHTIHIPIHLPTPNQSEPKSLAEKNSASIYAKKKEDPSHTTTTISSTPQSLGRPIQDIRRFLDSLGSGIPILLLNGIAGKGKNARF